ncbi:hypothetical protein GCM10010489_32680 [Microbacterium saperdae]|nr:hypothetical protein GCM10010489_32680 [Microbacterium saperdae]
MLTMCPIALPGTLARHLCSAATVPRISERPQFSMVAGVGTLNYGVATEPIHIEDRALAHLKIVIATKLRRNESFTLSWKHPDGDAPGRSTIWLHPSIPLRFTFDDAEAPMINVKWIEDLMLSANSTGGILLIDEVLDAADEVDPSDE